MFTDELRKSLSIAEIMYSESIDDNWELFHKGIDILKNHDMSKEFRDSDREVLEEIYTIINMENVL